MVESKRNKRFICVYLLIGIIFLLSGCKTTDPEPLQEPNESLRINLCFEGRDTNWISALEKCVNSFSTEHPEYNFCMDFSQEGSYYEFMNAKVATNEMPDLFELTSPNEYANAHLLGTLPDELAKLVAAPYYADDKLQALPVYSSINGIIYNQKIFNELGLEVPQNYEGFLEICDTLKNQGYTPIAFSGNDDNAWNNWTNYYFSLVLSENPDWLVQRNMSCIAFDSPEIRSMLLKYKQLFDREYIIDTYKYITKTQIPELMASRETVMTYSHPGNFSLISQLDPNYPLGWFFMPDDQGNPTAVNAVISYWCISPECAQNPEKLKAICEFLEFFYEKEQYRDIIQATSTFSTTAQVVLYPSLEINQALRAEYIYADVKSSFLGDLNTPPQFMDVYKKLLRKYVNGEITLTTMIWQLDAKWDELAHE